jgi:hypothetical protein
MFDITHMRSVAVLAAIAGLGASVYQHNQTDLEYARSPQAAGVVDGTSNTMMVGLLAPPRPG